MRNTVMVRLRNGRILGIPVRNDLDWYSVARMMILGGAIVLNYRITHEEYMMMRHEMFVMP